MPIYGYRCTQCSHELEVWQSMSDTPLSECPECGGRLQKMLYPVGVQFKGSGFYSTDYKNGSRNGGGGSSSGESSKGEGASKSASSSSDSGSGSGTTSESKPSASSGTSSTDSKAG